MNKKQNLTEFWDDFISLEEPEIADENLNEDPDTNLTKAKELLKPYITNHFSTGSYYIDENGIIYNLGNSGYGHAEVSELLNDNGLEIDYKIGKSSKFLKSAGWIRLNTNLNFIELPEKRITEEQKNSLLLALDLMLNNVKMDKKVQVTVNDQRTDYEKCLPEYIIKRIERYYTSGTLYESWWEESDPWDNVIKEPETVPELLDKDFLYHATYKPYWEEIKKDSYLKPGRHINWDDRYKTTRAIYLATDYDNAVYYAKNAGNVPEGLLKQIIVLKIDADKLDVDQLDADSNRIYDSTGDEGRSIEDPYTWKEVQYYKPIPVSAIVKVYDEAKTKESLNEVYPNKGESKKDFINRFMRVTAKEYPDVKQRYAVANSYWERRDRKRLKESEDHTQKAIDVFGTTYYKTRAGFMLKDGRLLDLTYGGGPREDHRNIQDAFDDVDLETDSDYLIKFMNEGNIRLIPEIPGINVATEPTIQQRKSLKDYIQFWINHERHFEIQYSNEKGQQIGWKEYNGYYPVDNIIEDLLNHFKLTESLSKETATAIIEGDQTHSELHGSVEFTQLDDSVRLNVKLKGLPKSQF